MITEIVILKLIIKDIGQGLEQTLINKDGGYAMYFSKTRAKKTGQHC